MNTVNLKQNAAQLLQQQQFARALEVCQKYCNKAKTDAEGFYLLGSIHGAMQNMPEAASAFKKAIQIQPNIPQLHFNLSIAQQKSNDLTGAQNSLEKAIALKPDFFEAYCNLADVLWNQGFVDEAYEKCLAAVRINPNFAPVHMTIGNILRDKGQYQEAIKKYNDTIALSPQYDQVYVHMGIAHFNHNNPEEAEACYKKAISLNPNNPGVHLHYGLLLHSKGDNEAACQSLQKTIAIEPDNALAYYNLGITQKAMGDAQQAATSLEKAIKYRPQYIDAYLALANIQRDNGAIDQAIATLDAGKAYQPKNAEYYMTLGSLLGSCGEYQSARDQIEFALKLEPENPRVHLNLALVNNNIGEYDRALQDFEKTLEYAKACNDDYAITNAIAGMAFIYERRKNYQKAYELIEPYLENCTCPRIALAFGHISGKLDKTDQAVAAMESVIDLPDTDVDTKIDLNFQLGKIYDEKGAFEKAFSHYREGNEIFRRNHRDMISRYSNEETEQFFDSIKNIFNNDYFATAPAGGSDSEKPVFVVGLPRSGTTLTEAILSSHEHIHGAGELPDIPKILKTIETEIGTTYPEVIPEVSADLLARMAQRYLAVLDDKAPDARRVVDKMPHNFLLLGLIAQLFPKAKIIHIQRYPVDNCLSIYFQRFNISHTYASDLRDLGNYYRLYMDIMGHWNRVLPVPVLNIRYDELVKDQERITRQMLDYCGLDWDPNCLAFHKAERDVATPSYDQVNKPMYTRSSGRWQHYQEHIQVLINILNENGSIARYDKAI